MMSLNARRTGSWIRISSGSGVDKRQLKMSVYDVLLESATVMEARVRSERLAEAGCSYDVLGANRDLVSEGESGLFAHTQGEWEDGLSRLVADRPGAMALGERGRRVVSERFEASLIGSRLADLLLSAAA